MDTAGSFQNAKADLLQQQSHLKDAVRYVIHEDSDMFIVSKDRDIVPCHKSLLTLFSPLVARLLIDVPCCIAPTIFLPDFPSHVIRKFLLILKSGQALSTKYINIDIKYIHKIASVLMIEIDDLGEGPYLHNPLGAPGIPLRIKQEKLPGIHIKQELIQIQREDIHETVNHDAEESEYVEEDETENSIENEDDFNQAYLQFKKSSRNVEGDSSPNPEENVPRLNDKGASTSLKETFIPNACSIKESQINSEPKKDSKLVRLIPDTPPKCGRLIPNAPPIEKLGINNTSPKNTKEQPIINLNEDNSVEATALMPNAQFRYPRAVDAFIKAVQNGMVLKNDEYTEVYDFIIEEDEQKIEDELKEEILKKEEDKIRRNDVMSALRKMLTSEENLESTETVEYSSHNENIEHVEKDDVDKLLDNIDNFESLVEEDFENLSEECAQENETALAVEKYIDKTTAPNLDHEHSGGKRKGESNLLNIDKKLKLQSNSENLEQKFPEIQKSKMKRARKTFERLKRGMTEVMRSGSNPENYLDLPSKMVEAINALRDSSDEAIAIHGNDLGEDMKRDINAKAMEEFNKIMNEFMIYRTIFKNKLLKDSKVTSKKTMNIAQNLEKMVVTLDDSDEETEEAFNMINNYCSQNL